MQRARMPVGHAVYTGFTFQSPGSKREANSSRSEEHFQGAKPIPGAVYANIGNIGNVHSWENHPDTAIHSTQGQRQCYCNAICQGSADGEAYNVHMLPAHECDEGRRELNRPNERRRGIEAHGNQLEPSRRSTKDIRQNGTHEEPSDVLVVCVQGCLSDQVVSEEGIRCEGTQVASRKREGEYGRSEA